MHTTASDGSWSPEAVVRAAAAGGLHVISITDHDNSAAFQTANAIGAEVQVQVIPGIEVSSTHRGRDIHVLGYFVDPLSDALTGHSNRASGRRIERMKEMLAKLAAAGIEIEYETVEEVAGPDRFSIGRPHLARAMLQGGHVSSMHEAFQLWIGDDGPACVPTHLLDPAGAVETILAAGGIPIWAHPPGDLVDEVLPGMIDAGLRGLEVYRPSHRRNDVLRYEGICRSAGLLMSGGSDWHSPDYGAALGDFFVESREVEGLLTAGGM